ncbi:EF-hand [Neocallimastix californiae]|uniref:EF-hand n=1 Tax=Neocallimastix californiae TaxID=1754190 RepID=A0A1Y2C3J2_9FUNG|nr:EF-hand [Neocallimastix californiae]|eukprot:ORY41467.1 EF-hand [Neocallimastix californiae]
MTPYTPISPISPISPTLPSIPMSEIIFNKYDLDHSRTIEVSEFKAMVYDLGYFLSDNELKSAIETLDRSGTGSISLEDFKKWWNSKDRWSKIKVTEENMKLLTEISNLFQTFDTDKSGTIDKSELNKTTKISKSKVKKVFAEIDTNGDGELSFNEFVEYLGSQFDGDISKYNDN